jgi:hypothetical protein
VKATTHAQLAAARDKLRDTANLHGIPTEAYHVMREAAELIDGVIADKGKRDGHDTR